MKQVINVTDNSNIELSQDFIEMLLQGVCKSYECEDFRLNKCRMTRFLAAIQNEEWKYSQNWLTPSKFFIHLVKYGEDAPEEVTQLFQELSERWNCMAVAESCDCEFFDEMKNLKRVVRELSDK
jgi:hypothetical protein